ncbi:CaiB/BaiF CoA-transferase family protein [Cupriavidus sp. BIC8F]|uniref:CaiB/BaiF CoA transferase family protein n=1 Tax=Cupriavidus sp. BIC8F TaxID=3079014 RepID=UPI002916A830|nr:CaiB/BaiF CoA-transferase family protein [Cupriavidus sp. BIC8F]
MPAALQDLKVLDLTRLLPGAFCTQLLADYGADVLKIEQPGAGDYNRQFAPINKAESGSFLLLNRNKRSLTLNLKTPEGKAIFLRLAEEADVIVEGFRPGVMKRLGLDYEILERANPRLVYCAISGYGQDGPAAQASGHDLNYMAMTGALQLFGTPATGPLVPGLSIADVGGGSLMAAFGILAALQARATSGHGQFVDISMVDGLVSWLCYHAADYLFSGMEPRGGERPFIGGAPCYNVYRCRDGRHISLGIIEDHFWHRFCDLIERPDLKTRQWPDGDDAREQYALLSEKFAEATCDSWARRLAAADIPAAPVNSMAEAFDEPQLRHRQMLLHIDHPVEGRIPQLGFPIKFSASPGAMRSPPPQLGEHNAEILGALGYDEAALAGLKAREVI